MGNNQASLAVCREIPGNTADSHLGGAAIPAEEELNSYMSDVRAGVDASVESFEARYQRYINDLKVNSEQLDRMLQAFVDELQLGLELHKEDPWNKKPRDCSFKMLDSFVPRIPSGKEHGVYYAIDFGGTHVRVVRCQMADGKLKTTQRKASMMDCPTSLPKGLLDGKATAKMMFDFFASVAEQFMRENGDLASIEPFPLGFTFSYPCVSSSLMEAKLVVWNKGFETGRETDDPVEGRDVCELLNQAFKRRRVPLETNCVANDTVGTMLSCAFSLPPNHPPCLAGLILGTGMNSCYADPTSPQFNYTSQIINIECGNFNRDLPRINIDLEIDFTEAATRGRQHLEKMVSGAYIGEVARHAILKVFQHKATPALWRPHSFSAEDAADCVVDKSDELLVVASRCQDRFEAKFSLIELQMIQGLCVAVYDRAAALAAMLICGTATKTGRLQHALGGVTIGVDGSLYKCNEFFRNDIRKYIDVLLGQDRSRLIHLEFAEDGSGLGAAILAAMAAAS
eukprot:Protomagalhaensia_sp_Gyna_25__1444@NODE_172_length_4653_cov_470_453186_g134_i0_p1_GENE_NODE_172_length_4653_cov_470_453186_g134_i0NODE_172_length_4653_cov_470_453186_g134_i0_p1_ORF_typecomplete_len512_score88_07Hexokinase_1/PF00349_21/3e53Hexokinase_2/PF03727_16/1_7e46_NODE_172_length_4653_cov_470_453186_g134_i0941629